MNRLGLPGRPGRANRYPRAPEALIQVPAESLTGNPQPSQDDFCAPESIFCGVPYAHGQSASLTHLRRERVEALVFPEKGSRQAPMSPVDGLPMPWAGPVRVLDLLKQQATK